MDGRWGGEGAGGGARGGRGLTWVRQNCRRSPRCSGGRDAWPCRCGSLGGAQGGGGVWGRGGAWGGTHSMVEPPPGMWVWGGGVPSMLGFPLGECERGEGGVSEFWVPLGGLATGQFGGGCPTGGVPWGQVPFLPPLPPGWGWGVRSHLGLLEADWGEGSMFGRVPGVPLVGGGVGGRGGVGVPRRTPAQGGPIGVRPIFAPPHAVGPVWGVPLGGEGSHWGGSRGCCPSPRPYLSCPRGCGGAPPRRTRRGTSRRGHGLGPPRTPLRPRSALRGGGVSTQTPTRHPHPVQHPHTHPHPAPGPPPPTPTALPGT